MSAAPECCASAPEISEEWLTSWEEGDFSCFLLIKNPGDTHFNELNEFQQDYAFGYN
jgi:hypothetical protein